MFQIEVTEHLPRTILDYKAMHEYQIHLSMVTSSDHWLNIYIDISHTLH